MFGDTFETFEISVPQLNTALRGGGRLWRKAPGLCPVGDQSAQDPISCPYGAHTKVLVMCQPDLSHLRKKISVATTLDALSEF